MNFKKLIQDIKPHAIISLAFFLVAFVFYKETFKGKIHKEDDVTQGIIKGTELAKYTTEDGEFPGWTNSIFSGMPSTLIKGKSSGNYVKFYNYLTPFNHTAYPFQILLLSFIGFYMLTQAFKIKPSYGALAAIAYGFATYSISSVEAAHYTKVLAMAMMPAILASLHWLFSGRYLLGAMTLAFNMALQIYYFHYQITFYTIICLLVMGIYYLFTLIKAKKTKQLMIAVLVSVLAVGAGVLANVTKIKSTSHFAENTMRGGNDLARASDSAETGKKGLERSYAFNWSYGKVETFTLLIPGFVGGSASENLSDGSALYKKYQDNSILEQGWPLYHGSMRNGTSGPIYIGAIVIFLFVLSLIILKDSVKWPLLVLTLFSFILGWGENFGAVNNFLFDHLPYFNKFRTPMMGFCIAQVTIPLMAFLGLKQLLENWKTEKVKQVKNTKAKPEQELESKVSLKSRTEWDNIKLAYYIVGGLCLLVALLGSQFINFDSVLDENLRRMGYGNLLPEIKEDRMALLQRDAFRSLLFISISFGLLWTWYTKKIQKEMAVLLIGVFAAFDLIGVDWRYLSWDEFKYDKGTVTESVADQADQAILADKDLHFRVYDLTNDPFNDNDGAAFHKMIGGYDPAKLSRYQDVIAEILSVREYSQQGLDMLNCKYLIGKDSFGRGVIPRSTMNGNAWFVSELKSAKDARAEMDLLKASESKRTATFNTSFEANSKMVNRSFVVDSNTSAKLISYHPDTMVYKTNNSNEGYLVFSEIFYDDWKVEIDNKPLELNKVDYTLRGLYVPAGNHTIKMYFDKGEVTTDNIERIVSIVILAGMIVMILLWLASYTRKEKA